MQPIVYYLDAGIPEPYRSAFKDGAMWWNTVFEAAGFKNAFRVEDMPADMDPMDARYNVIQWVHRTDPDYSIGPSFVDRARRNHSRRPCAWSRTARSPISTFRGTIPRRAEEESPFDPRRRAGRLDRLARSAGQRPRVRDGTPPPARRRHEVGHTLGLAHNFIAAFDGRASVMAYPAPLIKLTNAASTCRTPIATAPRVGFAGDPLGLHPSSPRAGLSRLAAIVRDGVKAGSALHHQSRRGRRQLLSEASTWVNGRDAVTELARIQAVRDSWWALRRSARSSRASR